MAGSDVVFSSVTYVEEDFCSPSVFKAGCTVIPVHMRGFKECDKVFDHVITSDLESIKKFQFYGQMRKLSRLNEVLKGEVKVREKEIDRILVYNLGIALYDIYFAAKIYEKFF
jgi:ornithine cyclodeaminase/alanine dehydrogenase